MNVKEKFLVFFGILVLCLPMMLPEYLIGKSKEKKNLINKYESIIEEHEKNISALEDENDKYELQIEEYKSTIFTYEDTIDQLEQKVSDLQYELDELYEKHGYYDDTKENVGPLIPVL